MDSNGFIKMIGKMQNMWQPTYIDEEYVKVYKDIWFVDSSYPFEITRDYEMVLKNEDEILSQIGLLPNAQKMVQMMMNSTYGSYGVPSSRLYGNPSHYYARTMSTNNFFKEYKYEEAAKVAQNEKLIAHYNHKIKKAPKKKEQVERLTKIIEMLEQENEDFITEYPERFI